MALGFSTNKVIVRCSQEPLQKLGEDYNVTWMMHLSKTNQEQYGHRKTKAKTTAFLFEMCLLAGIYMHKNPPYMYFSSSSVLYKEVACISPAFVPIEVSQECYQTFIAKVRSGILYMKHLKDFRRNLFGST